ncbi:hypothetical protein BDN72DRAFT_902900 [Pluteus cervinus]|uniref:Uncharacterized protein n=1 Tax=Pluteus cervinus TaxID=181527 RepID=A0ACD3AAF5_9AGAR|nr:hypothetical protein BDN72DRAFT_902900 [Pluteus cervinus]
MRLEVFRHVRDLSQRSIDALITLCHVCQQWRADVLGAPTLWSSIHNHSFVSYNLNLVRFVLQDILGTHRTLLSVRLGFNCDAEILHFVLKGFAMRIVCLSFGAHDGPLQLGFNTSSRVLATELPKTGSTLQELQLCDVKIPASAFDGDFRNFRTLKLSYCTFRWRFNSLTTLRTLAIYYPGTRADWQIITLLLVQLTQLEDFSFSQALSLGKDVDLAVPVSLTKVAIPFNPPSLSIFRVSENTIHSMMHLFHQLRFPPNQLKELDVSINYHRYNSDYEVEDVPSMERQFRTLFSTWFGPEPFPNNSRCADGCCLTFAYGKTDVRLCVEKPYRGTGDESGSEEG